LKAASEYRCLSHPVEQDDLPFTTDTLLESCTDTEKTAELQLDSYLAIVKPIFLICFTSSYDILKIIIIQLPQMHEFGWCDYNAPSFNIYFTQRSVRKIWCY